MCPWSVVELRILDMAEVVVVRAPMRGFSVWAWCGAVLTYSRCERDASHLSIFQLFLLICCQNALESPGNEARLVSAVFALFRLCY